MQNNQEQELIQAFRAMKPSTRSVMLRYAKTQAKCEANHLPKLRLVSSNAGPVMVASLALKTANKV